jgi:hypothetical protein
MDRLRLLKKARNVSITITILDIIHHQPYLFGPVPLEDRDRIHSLKRRVLDITITILDIIHHQLYLSGPVPLEDRDRINSPKRFVLDKRQDNEYCPQL